MTTRSTPNASATRRIAPKFCGSVMPSRTSTNDARSTASSKSAYFPSETSAPTPLCTPRPAGGAGGPPLTLPAGAGGAAAVLHAASGETGDLLARHLPHRHSRALRLGDGALQLAAVLARHADVVHAVGMRAQRLEDGVEAVDDHLLRSVRRMAA